METISTIALFFHIIGFMSLFGASIMQIHKTIRTVNSGMFHGALVQLISGLVLMMTVKDLNHGAAGGKFLILLIILGALFYYRRAETREIPAKPFFVIFGLTLAEVLIAVLFIG